MKKVLWAILAFMLVLGLAGAIAGGGQGEAAAPEAAEQVELILWGSENLHPPEGTKKDDAAIYKIMAKFERENPNIKVELIIQPAKQLLELFRAANAAKSGPDVIRLFGGSVNEYIPALLSLNDYFTEKELDKYMGLEYCRENYALSGPVYAIPADSYVCLSYYNKGVWAEAGFGTSDIPETWTDLLALCEKFKQQGVIAMFQGVKDGHQSDFVLSHLLANFVGADGVGWLNKLESFAGSEFEKAAEYAQGFTVKGYSNEDALSIILSEAPGRFFQAGAAMMYHGNWELKNLQVIMGPPVLLRNTTTRAPVRIPQLPVTRNIRTRRQNY
jgi:ABC-type glycerol-3-phosphate transport system substrate-binding protein